MGGSPQCWCQHGCLKSEGSRTSSPSSFRYRLSQLWQCCLSQCRPVNPQCRSNVMPKIGSRSAQGLEEDTIVPGVMHLVILMPAYNAGSTWNSFVCLQSLKKSRLPQKLRMVVLSNRPNFEFRAFQVCACTCQLNASNMPDLNMAGCCERTLLEDFASRPGALQVFNKLDKGSRAIRLSFKAHWKSSLRGLCRS